jgi:hypothetical protein
MSFKDVLLKLQSDAQTESTPALVGARWQIQTNNKRTVASSVPPAIWNEARRRNDAMSDVLDLELERRWLSVAPTPLGKDGRFRSAEVLEAFFDWATS